MFRFRPTVESLGDRALPSAVTAGPELPDPAQAAQVADAKAGTTESGKVSMQDFHFTSKVSVQDISIVIKVSKPSPTL